MKAILVFLTIFCCSGLILHSQSLSYYPIGSTGCKAGFYCKPPEFQSQALPDSSVLFIATCEGADKADYGVVCIRLHHAETSAAAADSVLQGHLVMLKTAFGADVIVSKEREKGITMPTNPKVTGVLDVFETEETSVYRTKSWTNGQFVAILFVRKTGEWTTTPAVEAFLNGFQFAAE